MADGESLQLEMSPEQQLDNVGKAIAAWAVNIENVDAGADSDGNTKRAILSRVEGLQDVTLDAEQQEAIGKIRDMSLATGIDTNKIRELAKLFAAPDKTA